MKKRSEKACFPFLQGEHGPCVCRNTDNKCHKRHMIIEDRERMEDYLWKFI